ncbi:MAG: hypothetical protein ACRDY2_10515 [Acidimicrobiales bacterium]
MRGLNRLLALLLALALVGAGGFMALETVLAAAGQRFVVIPGRSWLRVLLHTPWPATTVVVVMALIAGAGLVILLAEARRWPRWRMPVVVSGAPGRWWVTRRSVERHLSRRLREATPALRPRLTLTPREHHWRIKVVAGAPTAAQRLPLQERAVLDAPDAPDAPPEEPAAFATDEIAPRSAVTEQLEEATRQALEQIGAPEWSRVRVKVRRERRVRARRAAA